MQDQPSHIELLRAVIDFLNDKAVPNLSGQPAFHARVAANVLDIVVRELQQAPAANAAELDRLRALLRQDGSIEDLNHQFCQHIAGGDMTLDTPGLSDHLWQLTLDKLAIDQPSYATYRRIVFSQQGT